MDIPQVLHNSAKSVSGEAHNGSDRSSLELASHLYNPVPSVRYKSWGHPKSTQGKDILLTSIPAMVPIVHERPNLCISQIYNAYHL